MIRIQMLSTSTKLPELITGTIYTIDYFLLLLPPLYITGWEILAIVTMPLPPLSMYVFYPVTNQKLFATFMLSEAISCCVPIRILWNERKGKSIIDVFDVASAISGKCMQCSDDGLPMVKKLYFYNFYGGFTAASLTGSVIPYAPFTSHSQTWLKKESNVLSVHVPGLDDVDVA